MPIIYRGDGDWGIGKGANLSPAEVDGNFWSIHERVSELETNPPAAISIAGFEVADNMLTIQMSDSSTFGPFPMPLVPLRWVGEWQASTTYFKNDFFSRGGELYQVLVAHVSEASFDNELFTSGGFAYNRILAQPIQPYDIGMFHQPSLPGDGSILLQHVAARDFSIPAGFTTSQAFLATAVSTEDLSLQLYRNDQLIGTIEFNIGVGEVAGGQAGTFVQSPLADIQFSPGERLVITAPDVSDATAAGLSVTIAARTGAVSP